jgi:hypothetical protein
MLRRFSLVMMALLVLLATSGWPQNIISARAGFVNYKHGKVSLPKGSDGNEVRQLEAGQTAGTGHGRLELLLAPGSFVRLDNESDVRLASNRLTDVRLELLSGTSSVEVNEIPKHASLTLLWHERDIPVTHAGVYRFEPGPDSMRVYVERGKLKVADKMLKAGKYADLTSDGTLTAAVSFNRKNLDYFDRWNQGRSYQLARSSYSAANSFLTSSSVLPRSSLWYWDPFSYGYTYLPFSSTIASPWGFYYWSPRVLYYGGGYQHSGGSSGGSGGGSAVAGSAGSTSSASSPGASGPGGSGGGSASPGRSSPPIDSGGGGHSPTPRPQIK